MTKWTKNVSLSLVCDISSSVHWQFTPDRYRNKNLWHCGCFASSFDHLANSSVILSNVIQRPTTVKNFFDAAW